VTRFSRREKFSDYYVLKVFEPNLKTDNFWKLVQRTQILVECELNDKYQVQRTAISIRLRCAAPLRTSSAFFYKYYRDAVAFRFCYIAGEGTEIRFFTFFIIDF